MSDFPRNMEKFPAFEPEISPFPSMTDDSTDSEALEILRGRGRTRGRKRIRSWERNRHRKRSRSQRRLPSSLVRVPLNDKEARSNASKNHSKSWSSLISLPSTQKHSLSRSRSRQARQSSGNFLELPGSLDVFPETTKLASPTAFLSEEKPPPLPPRRQPAPFFHQALGFPEHASQTNHSSLVPHVPLRLGHHVSSSDLDGEYTLREALDLPMREADDNENLWTTDPLTGRVTPSGLKTLQTKASNNVDDSKERPGVEKWRSWFNEPHPARNAPCRQPGSQRRSNARRAAKVSLARLGRTFAWLRSKAPKRSSRRKEEKKPLKANEAVDGEEQQPILRKSQNCDPQNSPRPSTSSNAQENHWDGNAPDVVPGIVKRLSVTKSFCPPLADSIEDAILKTKSSELASVLSSKAYLDQPFPDGTISSFSDWPTSHNVRFKEPKRSRHRPKSSLQIPPPSPHLPSAYERNAFTYPRPPPALPPGEPFEQDPDLHLSLRGGCLPTPKPRNPPPRRRLHPDSRPADDEPVPRLFWYLAAGRPVLKDKPGQPCYHRQPKHKRRNNRPGPEHVPNDEPCEPLTYGHLRDWKRASRPADRLNLETGQMEAVDRSFWEEFFYSASGGRMASKRPKMQSQGRAGDA